MVKKDTLKGMKISVIGAGVSGSALAELAVRLGASVFVSDSKEITPEREALFASLGVSWEALGNTKRALDADLVVVSSGISPSNEVVANAMDMRIPVMGELDFVCPYLDGTVIAVTGSNGKTTTTSMTAYLLERAGYKVAPCGNIGNPVAKIAGEKYDFIVMELSSFQLYWAKKFRCDVAVVCNLAPDHIDWHGSYENYVKAKSNIIKCLNEGGAAIFQERDASGLEVSGNMLFPLSWKKADKHHSGIYMDSDAKSAWINRGGCSETRKLFDFEDVRLLGTHNLENTAMSTAVLSLFDIEASKDSVSSYVPPKHRCAFAGEVREIKFVDDSKGTNVAATITAMSALPGSKVIILGGQGKGEDYAPLACAVKKYTHGAVIIGAEKEKIAAALDAADFKEYSFAGTMEEAVRAAYGKADAGDTVLLSPACTSWDMYPNYGARGDDFCRAAAKIIAEEE